MAIGWQHVSFLVAARERGVDFHRTLVIGRQNLFATVDEIMYGYADAGQRLDRVAAEAIVRDGDGYTEPLFHALGASVIDSLDASDYENSTIVADLNNPLPEDLNGRYSLVVDGGSLEHVFNYPAALRSCLKAVAPGGHFLSMTETNGASGHGFYQFSPELFYRALSPENGYESQLVLMRAEHQWSKWLQVVDPVTAGGRVEFSSPWQTMIYVLGKRISDVEPLTRWPQQSDYARKWTGARPAPPQRARRRLLSELPKPARRAIYELRRSTAVLGRRTGPNHFRAVRMADVAAGH